MANIEAVKLAKDLIKQEFGTLDDLPKELTITIANLYYKFTAKLLEMMGFPTERKILIPESVKRQIKQFGSMVEKFLSGELHILAYSDQINGKILIASNKIFIICLRQNTHFGTIPWYHLGMYRRSGVSL